MCPQNFLTLMQQISTSVGLPRAVYSALSYKSHFTFLNCVPPMFVT